MEAAEIKKKTTIKISGIKGAVQGLRINAKCENKRENERMKWCVSDVGISLIYHHSHLLDLNNCTFTFHRYTDCGAASLISGVRFKERAAGSIIKFFLGLSFPFLKG